MGMCADTHRCTNKLVRAPGTVRSLSGLSLAIGRCPLPPGSPIPTQGPSVGHMDVQTHHPPHWAITPSITRSVLLPEPPCPSSLLSVPVSAPRPLFPPGRPASCCLYPWISLSLGQCSRPLSPCLSPSPGVLTTLSLCVALLPLLCPTSMSDLPLPPSPPSFWPWFPRPKAPTPWPISSTSLASICIPFVGLHGVCMVFLLRAHLHDGVGGAG